MKKRMMALRQAIGKARQVMRTISMGSQGVNVNHPPQINQLAPSRQEQASNRLENLSTMNRRDEEVPLIG